jgi:putative ABC transport system permease protein
MNKLIQDLRYGLRQLRKSPAFTLTVIVTLALGIGANTAVFTLFDQVLLRMLPVERPKELVRFQWSGDFSGSASSFGGSSNDFFSYPMYKDLRDQNQIFAGLLAADKASLGISWHNQSESDEAELVSGNYFQLLGLKPALGRLLTQQDDTARNSNPVVVLSYNAWKTRFGAVADIVGQTILINGHPFSVIGVAPQNFDSAIGGYRPSAFIPMSMVDIAMPWMAPRDDLNSHKSIWLTMVGRLKPGVTAVQAQASLEPLWHSLRAIELSGYKSPSERFKKGFLDNSHLKVLDDSKGFNPNRTEMQKPLVILMSMAGLLIALCAINVATLLLLRAAGRAREMSMRYALGAKRGRIVSQLLVEGGLLGIGGAAAGLALAPMVALALVRLMTSSDPGQEPYSASIDIRTLLFTLGVSLLASLLFSIAPIFHFLRPDLANSLRQSAGTASKGSQLFRKIAVGVQIALSVLLLGGAGLFVRTLDNLRHQSVGFETSNLATFSLDPSSSGYGEAQTAQIVSNSIDTLSRIPGVISVAATNDAELQGNSEGSSFSLQDYKTSEDEVLSFEDARVTANYFATLRHPLLVGREIASSDVAGQQPVAVVNLALAKKYYGSAQNAIGRLISEGRGKDTKFDTTIVGVVGDSRHTDLRTPLKPAIYRPYAQQKHPGGVEVYVRTTQAPEAIEPAIRTAIHQMDATLVVDELRTMQEQVDRAASDERALALLAISFSALALLLAAVGFYGVLAYSTAQRTREIGVRLALGSRRVDVVLLVVREMAMIAAIATAIALPSVVAVSHYFSSQLYGVTNFDPLSLGAAALLTALMVTVAAALPARRAAAIEPMQALRTE